MNNLPLRVESTLQNVKTKVLGGCKNVDRESYDPSHVLGCIKGGKSVITLDSNRDLGEDFMNEDLNDIFLLTASTSRANNDDDAAFSDAAVSDAAFSDAAISDAAFTDAALSSEPKMSELFEPKMGLGKGKAPKIEFDFFFSASYRIVT